MAKLASLEISYEMSRQPHGQYTSDRMAVKCLITYDEHETPDMLEEIKIHSGRLKLACEKRIGVAKEAKPEVKS